MVEQCTYEKYKLKKRLETLRRKSRRGTELISLYIPSDKQISDVINHLREEHGLASNITSKLTRTNVQVALESLLAKLRYLNKVPENGIVYFTGAVDIGANKTSMESEVLFLQNLLYLTHITVILFSILSLLRKFSEHVVLMGFYFLT